MRSNLYGTSAAHASSGQKTSGQRTTRFNEVCKMERRQAMAVLSGADSLYAGDMVQQETAVYRVWFRNRCSSCGNWPHMEQERHALRFWNSAAAGRCGAV